MTTTYQDKAEIKLDPPTDSSGAKIEEMIAQQGWQVKAVDWAFTKVTGESLVRSIIMPITGDWTRIQMNGDAWRTAGAAVTTLSDNLQSSAETLGPHWEDDAGKAHLAYIKYLWKAGLAAEAKVADLIAKGFDKVAEGSQKLCQKALDLLKMLVDKVVDAIKKAWIPAYGWIKAAELVWDAYQIYKKIMDIIETVERIVKTAQELQKAISEMPSSLEKIKDVRSVEDAIEVGKEIKDKATEIQEKATSIKDDATSVKDNVKGIKDDARELRNDGRDLNNHVRNRGSDGADSGQSGNQGSQGDQSSRRPAHRR